MIKTEALKSPLDKFKGFRAFFAGGTAAITFATSACSIPWNKTNGEVKPVHPTISASASPEKTDGFVTARGTQLTLNREPWESVGVDRYDLVGCRSNWSDQQLTQWFKEAQMNGVTSLRFWLFQSDVSIDQDHKLNAPTFDKAIKLAKENNIKLIPTLENHLGNCTWGPNNIYDNKDSNGNTKEDKKNDQWYSSGYKIKLGNNKLSYREYVNLVLRKYGKEPTIVVWDLINEPEAKGDILISFARDMHKVVTNAGIKQLTTFGTIGTGQLGTEQEKYAEFLKTEDIGSMHLYPTENNINDDYNGLQVRLKQAQQAGKPMMVGEIGVMSPPSSPQERSDIVNKQINDLLYEKTPVKIINIWSAPPVDYKGPKSYDITFSNMDPMKDPKADPTARAIKRFYNSSMSQ